jgi:hypothetical protein
MLYFQEHHSFSLTEHPDFLELYHSIQARIQSDLDASPVPHFDTTQHNTYRELSIISAFKGLILQGVQSSIPVGALPPSKTSLRNKSNRYDFRRAMIMEDCDDISLGLMDLIIISKPDNALAIFRFVHHLQLARQLYASIANSPLDD